MGETEFSLDLAHRCPRFYDFASLYIDLFDSPCNCLLFKITKFFTNLFVPPTIIDVVRCCTPFQIFKTVIQPVFVDMVHLRQIVLVFQKRRSHKSVYHDRMHFPVSFIKRDPSVSKFRNSGLQYFPRSF